MGLAWSLAGVVVVSAAFLLPPGGDHWSPLNAAGVAAGLYLVLLVAFATRKPFPLWTGLAVRCASLLAGAVLVLAWTGASKSVHSQREWMLKIRSSVSRTVMVDEMPSILLNVMQRYYLQSPEKRQQIGEIFRGIYPAALPGANIHMAFHPDDSLMIYVAELSDTGVVLVGQEMYIGGRRPGFKNFNGRSGMVQERATLTADGVRYESEN